MDAAAKHIASQTQCYQRRQPEKPLCGVMAVNKIKELNGKINNLLERNEEREEKATVYENAANNLQAEIENKWIPYGIHLKASLAARKVERTELIDKLKELDPTKAEQIGKNADELATKIYRNVIDNKEELLKVKQETINEALE